MALWFYQNPPELANPAEQLVANALNRLPDSWRIRWGFYYRAPEGEVRREGDFVVQGPGGHLCVIEVKGTHQRQFALTGQWDHGDNQRHPLEQLAAERKAIQSACMDHLNGAELPWIHAALALPNIPLLPADQVGGELEAAEVITHRDLENFPAWWARHIGTRQQRCADPIRVFHQAVAPGLQPEQVRLFLRRTDQIFNRFKSQEFELLDMLERNRQLLVQGGAGTGKTFMALRLAERLASEGTGRSVLFLCYNLFLGENLRRLVAKLRPERGTIKVMTWEDLAIDLLRHGRLEHTVPAEPEAKRTYYECEMPGLILQILEEKGPPQTFEALVVDEAQDLDTGFPPPLQPAPALGWWHVLFSLLTEGTASPMALFADPAQRLGYRNGPFELEDLFAALSQPVHIRLRRTVRFTRQINAYLQTLRAPATEALLERLQPHPQCPVGPEVVIEPAVDGTAAAVARVVQQWRQRGLCNPDEILILGPRRDLAKSSLQAVTEIAGFPLERYAAEHQPRGQLHYLGVHAAKGLDALAIILIDFPPFEASCAAANTFQTTTHFLGASRARQLLAVIQAPTA